MAGPHWEVRSARDASPNISWNETGQTFLENARIKVNAIRKFTGHCILADDSGLQVDALNGAPGVWSSNYAGVEGDSGANNKKLIEELSSVPAEKRTARFVCTLLFVDESGEEQVFTGECHGKILTSARGENGFGYDPLFEVAEKNGRTMAELTAAEKNEISHRALAMAKWNRFIEHP